MKTKLQLVQVNSSYGNQYFIPYSVGLLQAYCNQFDEIKRNFDFLKIIYKQEINLEQQVKNLGKLDIVAQSCYLWNWQFNLSFAKLIKKNNPNAIIIFGGPQIPDNPDGFFEKYPFVDILCHGEGELVFCEILKEYANNQMYDAIEGISVNDTKNNKTLHNPRRPRVIELENIPSPYLEGVFSELLNEDAVWQASWETNRGCPYRCTFCVWGSEYFNKIRKFPLEERLLKEIDWFSKSKISLVFGCDANFGIFERDIDIATALVETKEKTGYPEKFRVCSAKNSNDRVFKISKILNNSGMLKGASLSVQSMDEDVLSTIKRKNIGLDKFKNLLSKFNDSSISTYTELILPLPNETYNSFISGIDTLFHGGQHSQLNIYNCTILANSEMASSEYVKEHNIQTVEAPVFQAHVDNKPVEYVQESEIVAVGTKTMPKEDWKKCQEYSWAVQTFHTLGLLQYVAIVFVNKYNLNYSNFYLSLIEYAQNNPNAILGLELEKVNESINKILNGKSQGQLVPEYDLDIIWPSEEASVLRILEKIDLFYDECKDFVDFFIRKNNLFMEKDFLKNLIALQKESMVHYNDDGQDIYLDLDYNLDEFVKDIKSGVSAKLIRHEQPKACKISKFWKLSGNKKQFAKEIIWFGRKGGKYINNLN